MNKKLVAFCHINNTNTSNSYMHNLIAVNDNIDVIFNKNC